MVFESGNGGEIAIISNDLALGPSLLQQGYVCLFGGNVEADTLGNEVAGQIRQDYWANALLFAGKPAKQFNSQTERALRNNPLTSTGRINIQRAAEADLSGLSGIATVTADVTILSTDKVQIKLTLTEPGGPLPQTLTIVWDALKQSAIIQKII